MRRFTQQFHDYGVVESPRGEYVLLSDVEGLIEELKDTVQQQQVLIEELKQTIFNFTGHVIK